MPGFYPEIPDHKFAYDVDGTVVLHISPQMTIISTLSQAQKIGLLTNETAATINADQGDWFVFIFPELRNIVGVFVGTAGHVRTDTIETSTNTSNGIDGDWVNQGNYDYSTDSTPHSRRTNIHIVDFQGVQAIRIRRPTSGSNSSRLSGIDLYGNVHDIENTTKLRVWHPTDNEEVPGSWFDYGDIPRTADQTKQFRIKNNSGSLSASNISLNLDGLPDVSPSLVGQFQLSIDNTNFVDNLSIGDLGPGEISDVLYARLQVAPDASLGLQQARMSAIADSWS